MHGDPVLMLRRRLTGRDVHLLDWLADHEVLTTFQIAHALFGSLPVAQRRLLSLYRLGAVDRFRPFRAQGSHPWHYVLGHLGAQWLAARRGEAAPRPSASAARVRQIAAGRLLEHQLGINQFFTDLAGHARLHGGGAALERWWPERACAQPGAFALGLVSPARPDAHGVWAEDGHRVAFFLEYDRGGESQRVLGGKLAGYEQHVARGGPAWPVLFWLPSAARERHLHHTLAALAPGRRFAFPIATTSADRMPAGTSPADAVWLLHGTGDPPRRLIDLASTAAPQPNQ